MTEKFKSTKEQIYSSSNSDYYTFGTNSINSDLTKWIYGHIHKKNPEPFTVRYYRNSRFAH